MHRRSGDNHDRRRALLGDMDPPRAGARPSSRGRWSLLVLFSLVVAAVFVLAALLLAVPFKAAPPAAAADAGRPGHGAAEQAEQEDAAAEHIHHQDDVPAAPRLRDPSEYVLDPSSWRFASPPVVRHYRWTIVDGDLNPDGVYRPMMLINNQFPGPLVECNEGDTLVVDVENRAANATAIHFHGLFQNGTNSMDGTVGVTQCPIAPNASFTYRFDVRGQSGTYWYHAHHAVQASDGPLGPLIVHARDELALQGLGYASDRIVMVQDHYHNASAELLVSYLEPGSENDEPVPDNPLINGRGLRSCDDFPGWRCDGANASRPVLDVAPGARHRLRVINVGAFAEFQIQVDEHPFYVTEVDGTDVHPEPFHRLNVLPAQRYSIVLEANATTGDAFWLRARMVAHCFTTKNRRLQAELWAVVRYASPGAAAAAAAPAAAPRSREWPEAVEVVCRDLDTSALRPVKAVRPPPADDFLALRANFEIGAWRLARGFFNDSSWRANATHPSLHRFLDAARGDGAPEPAGLAVNEALFARRTELVVQTAGVRTVDIAISNFDDGAHPFHLHGHALFVMAQGRSGYPPTAAQWAARLAGDGDGDGSDGGGGAAGGANPLRRDTVAVEAYGWVVVRAVLDNPGLWALRCHNAWHAAGGMVMQLLARADVVAGWAVDARQRALCGREGVARGAPPEDGAWAGLPEDG